jgi:hypothetical protein
MDLVEVCHPRLKFSGSNLEILAYMAATEASVGYKMSYMYL